MPIAIMSAMHEENASIVEAMDVHSKQVLGSRTYHSGTLEGVQVVVVFSHWGKVAASITATTLINEYEVDEIVFTGVAGAICNKLSVGDILVGSDLYQHDMDASPIIPRHEIPLLERASISTDKNIREKLKKASEIFIRDDFSESVNSDAVHMFNLQYPQVSVSSIASGDQFISDRVLSEDIGKRLPGVAGVEMEGAAVAQVCDAYDIPFGVVRIISDGTNETSERDFQSFVIEVARVYSLGIIRHYLRSS